jgi:hemolysin-activating ACP:hemolysin acyltransferase
VRAILQVAAREVREMIRDLKEKVFPGRDVKFVAVTKEGKKEVRMV